MGKASSTKKIQRAARSGAKTSSGKARNLLFPGAVALILVIGIGLIGYARSQGPGQGSPQLGEHWHAAFGMYVCDRWVTDLSDRGPDTLGIHTHDDGLVHIHPFLAGATGRSATLGKFFDQVGMEVSDDAITLPPGDPFENRTYKAGETTCDGEDARVVVGVWDDARQAEGAPDTVVTSDFDGIHFDSDFQALTLAFVPEGTSIPPPPSANTIETGALNDTDPQAGQAPDDTLPTDMPEVPDLPTEDTLGGDQSGDPEPAAGTGSEETTPAGSGEGEDSSG